MKSPIEQLKYDLDQGDFDPHTFRKSIHSSIWDLVQEIKLTPEDEGLTPDQEKQLYAIDHYLCGNLRIDLKEHPNPDS